MTDPKPPIIPVIKLVREDMFLVTLRGFGYRYIVDGLPAPINQEFAVPRLESIRCERMVPSAILYWRNDAGDTMPHEEYLKKRRELQFGHDPDAGPDPDEVDFPSLEAEFAFRKFDRAWSPVQAPETWAPVELEFEVTEIRTSSGDPDIISMWNSPSTHASRLLYQMNRNQTAVRLLRAACAKANLAVEIPTHSGIRFAKINGAYVFDGDAEFGDRPFIGDLDQCTAEKARISGIVDTAVAVLVAKRDGVPVRNVGELLLQLRELRRGLDGVMPVSRHVTAKRRLEQELHEIITNLVAEVRS